MTLRYLARSLAADSPRGKQGSACTGLISDNYRRKSSVSSAFIKLTDSRFVNDQQTQKATLKCLNLNDRASGTVVTQSAGSLIIPLFTGKR